MCLLYPIFANTDFISLTYYLRTKNILIMNRITTYLLSLLTVLLTTIVVACSDDDNAAGEPEIIVAKTEINFAKDGGTFNLFIKSNVKLEVISSATDWCTVEKVASTSTTVSKYAVTTTPNTTNDLRSATLTVTGGNITQTVTVSQPATDVLTVTGKTNFAVKSSGETIAVELQANGNYTVTINDPWILEAPATRSLTAETEQFIIASNSGAERTGTITFALGTATSTVTIVQEAFVPADPDQTGMESDARTLAAKIYAGWNLGNTLEAPGSETGWGNPKATKALIDAVKSAGFNAVRIPCAWDSYIIDAANHTISPEWLTRVKEVVNYCIDNDMYAIVNIHWDGGWLENNCTPDKQEEVNKKQKALWTQIAVNFADYDERLLFAGCNEPNVEDAAQMTVLKSYEQTFIDAVRATGGKNYYRNLIIQGPSTDIDKTNNLFGDIPNDVVENRLMAEVHYYTPWNFCGMEQDETWGKMFYFWGTDNHIAGSDRNSTWGEENDMQTLFRKMKTQFVDKGIPVILGEYGAIRRNTLTGAELEAHLKSRRDFNRCVTEQAKNYGLIPFYWDNGAGDFSLINRANNTVGDAQLLEAIMTGAQAGRYPF